MERSRSLTVRCASKRRCAVGVDVIRATSNARRRARPGRGLRGPAPRGRRYTPSRRATFLLGHTNANVTRAVYVHEFADARRAAMRRSKIAAAYGSAMEAAG